MINLYSDTQTQPTAAMRKVMAEAPVGDEQRDEDPSVNRLCSVVCELLGKERAVFLPSGTMCNEIAILVHCRAGDEILADRTAHIINFEAGGPAAFAGAMVRAVDGANGRYTPQQLRAAIREENRYGPRPSLAVVEQTSNLGGGAVWPEATVHAVADVARARGLKLHMDGARLMNAVVASGTSARRFGAPFDSVWIDLSKGLGCPVGAVLAGSTEFIAEAWRWKQRIGGAMRQAGILAAAGIHALEHHVERLQEDHENAQRFAELVSDCKGLSLVPRAIETNIVFMDISATNHTAPEVSARLEERGVRIGAMSDDMLRAVTHLDVDRTQVEQAAAHLHAVMK